MRIDLLTAGTCVSLMMQDSERSCEIALWRRRDGERLSQFPQVVQRADSEATLRDDA